MTGSGLSEACSSKELFPLPHFKEGFTGDSFEGFTPSDFSSSFFYSLNCTPYQIQQSQIMTTMQIRMC